MKNFDLLEILNSDREGRSENKEEDKYDARFEEENEERKGNSYREFHVMEKIPKHRHRELESSEDYYSEDVNTTYYKNMQESAKRLRRDDQEESKSLGCKE